jgi:hypothetical protein
METFQSTNETYGAFVTSVYIRILSYDARRRDNCRPHAGGETWVGYGLLDYGTTDRADCGAFE